MKPEDWNMIERQRWAVEVASHLDAKIHKVIGEHLRDKDASMQLLVMEELLGNMAYTIQTTGGFEQLMEILNKVQRTAIRQSARDQLLQELEEDIAPPPPDRPSALH